MCCIFDVEPLSQVRIFRKHGDLRWRFDIENTAHLRNIRNRISKRLRTFRKCAVFAKYSKTLRISKRLRTFRKCAVFPKYSKYSKIRKFFEMRSDFENRLNGTDDHEIQLKSLYLS